MPSPTDVDVLRRAQARLSELAIQDLEEYWRSLDLSRPELARDGLLDFVPTLTTVYGEAGTAVTADWYDEVRAAERVPGRFAAVMAAPFPAEAVAQRVRFGAAHLFTDTPDRMLPFLSGAVDEYVLQPARDTIARSSFADPEAGGWARQARAGACDFCKALAAKGAVYRRATVGFAAHGKCGCAAVPSWDKDAPEVPVEAYRASERRERLRRRAAAGDVSAQRQLEDHRRATREWVARERADRGEN